jgi:Helicase associated domain.
VEGDDDKNLGRWINRQRSLYQAGKLKDDRRKQLEEVGLKWAVLSTTSWQTMYDALCEYASSKRSSDKHGLWDGNVPASYETDEKPPKKLGRWVNRQRSAYANKKLKKEFVEKLEKAGLKWTANDCKKDMEPDDVVRQRMLAQSQKGIIRSVPQGIKSGTVVVNSGAGPIVAGKAPITSQKVITNASVLSMNITKVHPSLLKGAVPSSQKSVTPSTTSSTTTVTTSRPIQSKVIIPSRSVAKPSTSKVIIPARSLAENGGSVSKVVIPARSAASARISKVVIPARSLAQMGSTTSKVTLPARASIAMATKAKKVVPPGSIPRSQESATVTAKVGTLNSNIPTSASKSSVKTIIHTADKLVVQSTSTPIISKPPSSSANANPRLNTAKPAKSGSFSNDASISQGEKIKTGNHPVMRPSSKTYGGTLGSNTLKDKMAPAVPLTVSQRSPGKATVNNKALAPSIVSSQKVSSLSIVNNSVSSTSSEAKSPAPTSSTGASLLSSKVAINTSNSAKNSCQGNVINGALVSYQKVTPAQLIGTKVTKVAPPSQLRTVSQNSKAHDDHTSCIKSKVMAALPRTSGVVHSSRPAEAGANSSSSPKVKNDE